MQQAQKPTIVMTISPSGEVGIDAQCFQGNACEKATEPFEVLLGGGIAKKDHKPEFFQPPSTHGQTSKATF